MALRRRVVWDGDAVSTDMPASCFMMHAKCSHPFTGSSAAVAPPPLPPKTVADVHCMLRVCYYHASGKAFIIQLST